ncbi:hypothetical protein BP422_01700 [Brevibacillus formosus]|uniref:Uncharacterized protein n=1 Tax=Brevibacillus formosus TaxID=54913 RepID=A0A220MBK6_9BACL|nr:hypothetical protein [Brevibacillus formosus]ASJ52365.1 hypothetical protein BP422_01700 [Brevibacillus formosus]
MELDRSFRKKMVPIPYWKLTTVFTLFIASFIIWQVWENQNRLYTDNLYMKRSIFTGVMFQVEFLREPNKEEIENLIRDSSLPPLAFIACGFFSFSLWRSWFKIQELLEETAYYMSRL